MNNFFFLFSFLEIFLMNFFITYIENMKIVEFQIDSEKDNISNFLIRPNLKGDVR